MVLQNISCKPFAVCAKYRHKDININQKMEILVQHFMKIFRFLGKIIRKIKKSKKLVESLWILMCKNKKKSTVATTLTCAEN